jgi:hypothetical protein
MNATKSARIGPVINGFAFRKNSAVSTTVIGTAVILTYYTQFA